MKKLFCLSFILMIVLSLNAQQILTNPKINSKTSVSAKSEDINKLSNSLFTKTELNNATVGVKSNVQTQADSIKNVLKNVPKLSDAINPDTRYYTKLQMDSVIANYLTRNPVITGSDVPAQNLVKYSETLDNAVWSPTGLTITANSSIDMNGVATLETVTASNVYNNLRYVNGSSYLAVTPGTTYKVSFDCRRGTMTDMKYSVMNVTASTLIVDATSYYSQTNSSNVSRVSYIFTAPSGCVTAAIYLLRDSGTVGQTVYIGRVQVNTVTNAPYCTTTTTNVP